MAGIAKRLVLGFPATAECNPVAGFVDLTVGRFNRYAALNRQRAADATYRILGNTDRRFEFRFDRLTAFIAYRQSAG